MNAAANRMYRLPWARMRTPPVFWPQLVAIKAGAHALAGKVAEGLVRLDDALELAAHGYTSSIPEFSMLKGDCSLSPAPRTPTRALVSKDVRRCGIQGLRMTQLRAARRICRLWRSQGRDHAARLLRTVYDTFTAPSCPVTSH